MRIEGGGGAPAPRPMTIEEEVALIRRHAAEAERERAAEEQKQEQEDAAVGATSESREAAENGLDDYQREVENHQQDWAENHAGEFSTEEEAIAAWQEDWENSQEGQDAAAALAPHLAAFDDDVQTELRTAAENAEGDVGEAIQEKADEIRGRETDGSISDEILDGMVDEAAARIAKESPEVRQAALEVSDAQNEHEEAVSELEELEQQKEESLENAPQNMGFRQEIIDSYQSRLNAARERVAESEQALTEALEYELALILAEDVLAGAEAGVEGLRDLPSGIRDAELPYASSALSEARTQYEDVLDGKIDLKRLMPDQVDEAMFQVFANHPELANTDNIGFAMNLIMRGEVLKVRPELEHSLSTLRADENTPDWMAQLIEEQPTVAALVDTLGVGDVAPENDMEALLAEEDPLTFAMLKFVDASIGERDNETAFGQADTEEARLAAVQAAAQAEVSSAIDRLSLTPEGAEKVQRLQNLIMASGDVAASWADRRVDLHFGRQSPGEGLDEIVDRDEADDGEAIQDEDLSAGELAMRDIETAMLGAFTPEQQMMIWERVSPRMEEYIGQQVDLIEERYEGQKQLEALGLWLDGMSEHAPPPAASLLIDEMNRHFDFDLFTNSGIRRGRGGTNLNNHGERFVEALQQVTEKAPHRAGDVAEWMFDDNTMGASYFMAPEEDGTGVTLGQAVLTHLRLNDGNDALIERLDETFQEGLGEVEENLYEQAVDSQYELFQGDVEGTVQGMFDDLLNEAGSLYTRTHDLSGMSDVDRRNLIGDALTHFEADNPDAEPGEDKYTDPDKVSEINQVLDWIHEAGDENATVTFSPAIYASEDEGVRPLTLVMVEHDSDRDGEISGDEQHVVDASMATAALSGENVAWKYNDLEDFQKDNQLSEGRLYMTNSEDMLLRRVYEDGAWRADVNLEGIEAAITTGWERARRYGDVAIGVAGLVAGAALIVGTGGMAAPLVAAGAAVYFGARTIETAHEMHSHGQSFNPINTESDSAWFGVIDPTAGGFWLGAAASATGFAALRPVAMAGRLGQLGRGATIADELLLARHGLNSTSLSRNLGTDWFLRNGLQTNLYQAQLKTVNGWVSGSAIGSGAALTAGQAQDFYRLAESGELDLTDWSIDSATWDFALMGGGVASMGAGFAPMRSRAAAADRPPGNAFAIPEGRAAFRAHRQQDGTYLFQRINEDGQLSPDLNAPMPNGEPPVDVIFLETSTGADGRMVAENAHMLSANRDGMYRASSLYEHDGWIPSGNAATPRLPVPGAGPDPVPDPTPPPSAVATDGGPERPTVMVRDPDTGETVQARLHPRNLEGVERLLGDDGVLDGSQILRSGERMENIVAQGGRNPSFHLVVNENGVAHLLPIIAGASSTPPAPQRTPAAQQFADGSHPDRLTQIASASREDLDGILAQPDVNTLLSRDNEQSRIELVTALLRRSDELNGVISQSDLLTTLLRTDDPNASIALGDSFYDGLARFIDGEPNLRSERLAAMLGDEAAIEGLLSRETDASRPELMALLIHRADALNGMPARGDAFYESLARFADSDPSLRGTRLTVLRNGTELIEGVGDFGPIFAGNIRETAIQMETLQGGEFRLADRPDLGPVSLIWGDRSHGPAQWAPDGYGLAHIAAHMPDVIEQLPTIVDEAHFMRKVPGSNDMKAELRHGPYLQSGSYKFELVQAQLLQGGGDGWILTNLSGYGRPNVARSTQPLRQRLLAPNDPVLLGRPEHALSPLMTGREPSAADIAPIVNERARKLWENENRTGRLDGYRAQAEREARAAFAIRFEDAPNRNTVRVHVQNLDPEMGGLTWSDVDLSLVQPEGVDWRFDPINNRTTAFDYGDLASRALNSGDRLALYDPEGNSTYLIDLANKTATYFGDGDNRALRLELDDTHLNPEASLTTGRARRVKERFHNRVDQKGEAAIDDQFRVVTGNNDAMLPTVAEPAARVIAELSPYMTGLERFLHDGNLRPESHDRRNEPEFFRVATRPGFHAEAFTTSVGPAFGAGDPLNPAARRATYKGADLLDTRHIAAYEQLSRNFQRWGNLLGRLALRGEAGRNLAIDLDAAVRPGGDRSTLDETLGKVMELDRKLAKDLRGLTQDKKGNPTDPYLALKVHLGIAGGNPADPATAARVLDLNLNHFQDIAGTGQVILFDELITPLLVPRGQDFRFNDPSHLASMAQLLAVQEAMGKVTYIRSDWGPIERTAQDRPGVTRNRNYDRFDATMAMIAAFARMKNENPDVLDSGIIISMGSNRFGKPDATPMPTTAEEAVHYGRTIPLHIRKMEEGLELAPGAKYDLSASIQDFVDNPDLLDGLVTLIRRKQNNFIFSTNAAKPENRGQYARTIQAAKPLIARLGASGADGPALVTQVFRTNFERLMNRATERPFSNDVRLEIHDNLRAYEQQFSDMANNPTAVPDHLRPFVDRLGGEHGREVSEALGGFRRTVRDRVAVSNSDIASAIVARYKRNGVVVQDGDQTYRIVDGLDQRRITGEAEFNQAINNAANYDAITTLMNAPDTADIWNAVTPGMPDFSNAHLPRRPLRGEPSDDLEIGGRQEGMAAGGRVRDRNEALENTITTEGSAVLAGWELGQALGEHGILITSGTRLGLSIAKLKRSVFGRKLADEIFEDGQVKESTLNAFTQRVGDLAREHGVPEKNIAEFTFVMGRLRANLEQIHALTAHMMDTEAGRFERALQINWAVGRANDQGAEVLGLAPGTLFIDDARILRGRLNRTADTTLRSAHSSAWTESLPKALDIVDQLPLSGGWQFGLKGVIWGAYVIGMVRNTGAGLHNTFSNYLGRSRENPQLHPAITHTELATQGLSEVSQLGNTSVRLAELGQGVSQNVPVDVIYVLVSGGIIYKTTGDMWREFTRTYMNRGPRKPPVLETKGKESNDWWMSAVIARAATESTEVNQALLEMERSFVDGYEVTTPHIENLLRALIDWARGLGD